MSKRSYLNAVEGTVTVTQGHACMDGSETTAQMPIADALEVANKFNYGGYHEDVYVIFPDHVQVVIGNDIVAFVERSEVVDECSA